jgi:hypothetical protein
MKQEKLFFFLFSACKASMLAAMASRRMRVSGGQSSTEKMKFRYGCEANRCFFLTKLHVKAYMCCKYMQYLRSLRSSDVSKVCTADID